MMLVEIVRLLIVLTCTAGGFALTRSAFGGSNQPVLGATLGALVGYVIGGAVGRLLRRGMGVLEEEVARAPAAQVLAGILGAAAFGFVAALVSLPAVFAIPGGWGSEVLEALRRDGRVAVHVLDDEMPEFATVDAKLTALARRLEAGLVTTDSNLQHVAELQGVRCLNVNRLANSMRPPILPGEVIRLP